MPGSGRSMPVDRAQNLADLTQALQQVLMALDVPRVQVVGHSMGAAVSILLADAAPSRVSGWRWSPCHSSPVGSNIRSTAR
ncbi:MAG: alpha/beta fold hydrolase [Caldilineaceae bacterium]